MADSPKVFCKFCDTLVTIKEACCSDCYKPAPVRLSAEMLVEEDLEALAYVKQLVLDYRRRMALKRLEVGNSNDSDVVLHYDNEVKQAHKGVLLLLRLLGSADKGGK